MGASDDERIVALVALFSERREAGEALAPEAFLAQHPEGGQRLRAALDSLLRTESLMGAPPSGLPPSVGPYRVLSEIGRGGVGRVLEVEHEQRPGQPLALKLLHVTLAAQPRARERFRREAAALGRVTDPGVVRVVDSGLLNDQPYLVMERVKGESLAERLARQRASGLPDDKRCLQAARLLQELARTVTAAHRTGVLHRDLKPANVLVRPDGSPVLIDFGLVHEQDAATLTGSGDILGTPQYMSPEQARGETLDERCDVYGLGAILYECITLRAPRPGSDSFSVLRAAGTRPLSPARRLNPALPRPLDTIVGRATAYRASRRYPSAADLAHDLALFLEGRPIRARPASPVERVERAWLLHGRVLGFGAALLLLALCAWVFTRKTLAPLAWRLRGLHQQAAVAWLDRDNDALASLAASIHELQPADPLLPHLRAVAANDLPANSPIPLLATLAEGERLFRGGHPAQAYQRFDVADNLLPNTPEVLAGLGLTAWQAGDRDRAREIFEHAARELGDSAVLHRTLAAIYLEDQLFLDAQRAAAVAATLAPQDPAAWLLTARARLGAGDRQGALEALEAAAARGGDVGALRAELATDR